MTTSPEPIPTRLIKTCTNEYVDVVRPKITMHLLAEPEFYAFFVAVDASMISSSDRNVG
jgi:hypothetical protein